MNRIGACRFCGQVNCNIDYDECETQAEADELATKSCSCFDATCEAHKQEQIQKSRERIIQLFGVDAEKLGLDPVNGSIIDIMDSVVEIIVHNSATSMTLQIDGNTKAKISITSKGTVKVERSETNKYKLEE